MNKELNKDPRSSRLPQLKVLKPSTKTNQKKESSRAIIKTSDKSFNISQKPTPGTPEEGKHLRKTLQTTVLNTTLVENSAVGKRKFKVVKDSKNIGRAAVATASTNITYIVPTKENNYNKENKENDAVGRLLPYVRQTEMSLFMNPSPVIETTTSHSNIELSFDSKKMSLESIITSPSTSTAITKVGEINVTVSRLDYVGDKDVVMSDVGDPLRSQKVLGSLSPTRKRKIEEDKDQNIRNVRTKKVPELSDFNAQEQKLQELRAESIQFQGNIEEIYIIKSALFSNNTFLENEKNRLQHEKMEVFAQVCQLEHELACENAEIVKLLDEIVERKNDMRFLKQENDDLLCERVNYEKKAAAAKHQLEELIKFSAKIENEFREVVHQLEQKIGVNDALKTAVDEIKTQMDSHLNVSEPDSVSSSRWRCNIL